MKQIGLATGFLLILLSISVVLNPDIFTSLESIIGTGLSFELVLGTVLLVFLGQILANLKTSKKEVQIPELTLNNRNKPSEQKKLGFNLNKQIQNGREVEDTRKRLKQDFNEIRKLSKKNSISSGDTNNAIATAFLFNRKYPLVERFKSIFKQERSPKRVEETVKTLEDLYYGEENE